MAGQFCSVRGGRRMVDDATTGFHIKTCLHPTITTRLGAGVPHYVYERLAGYDERTCVCSNLVRLRSMLRNCGWVCLTHYGLTVAFSSLTVIVPCPGRPGSYHSLCLEQVVLRQSDPLHRRLQRPRLMRVLPRQLITDSGLHEFLRKC